MTCLTFEFENKTVYIPRPRTYEGALRCARDAFPSLRNVPDHAITFLTHWRLHGKRLKWQQKPIVIPHFTWTTIVPVMAQGLAILIDVYDAANSGAGRRRRSMTPPSSPEATPPESPVIIEREDIEPMSVHESTGARPVLMHGGEEHPPFAGGSLPPGSGGSRPGRSRGGSQFAGSQRGESPFTGMGEQSAYTGEHTSFAGPPRTHTSFSRSRHGTPSEHTHQGKQE